MTELSSQPRSTLVHKHQGGKSSMASRYLQLALLSASLLTQASVSYSASVGAKRQGPQDSSSQPVNVVVQWNRTRLVIVRTPGAQPATVHPTRSFAILHAAIYDAVNAIDRTHRPSVVRVPGVPRDASQEAAAAAAAHEVLVALYPGFQAALDGSENPKFQIQSLIKDYGTCEPASALTGRFRAQDP